MTKLTEAERAYDATRLSPVAPAPTSDAIEIEIAKECDRIIADHRAAGQPERPRFPIGGTDADVLRWREQMRQVGSPLFNDLLDWIAGHYPPLPAPAIQVEQHYVTDVTDEMIAQFEANEARYTVCNTPCISKVADPVTVTHQDGWDEYVAGDTEITVTHQDGVIGDLGPICLYIRRQQLDERITYELLTRLMCDLGHLLSDDRVLAALGQPPMSAGR